MLRKTILFGLLAVGCFLEAKGQTALTGDRFGGRLWYHPTNYSVGSYSAHTVCGDSNQLYSWGANSHGELGYKNMGNRNTPIAVSGMTNVYYYSAGYVAGAIKKDKSGWVWGGGFSQPTHVIDDAVYLDAGERSVCFIKSDGTVWSIGKNYKGAFGNGSTISYYSEPTMMKNITNAVRVANGYYVTLVLTKEGKVFTSGTNESGGLLSDQQSSSIPIQIEQLSNIVAIAASRFVNMALDKDGAVYIWGRGHGNWGGTFRKVDELSNIVAISARNDGAHLMALDSSGNCYSWGHNYYKQLGTGNGSSQGTPKLVATNVVDILAGESFSYIVKKDMSLWCTGTNHGGSIWLSANLNSSYDFVEIDLNRGNLGICSPTWARFNSYEEEELFVCEGDTLFIGNQTYYEPQTLLDTFTNTFGLDSIHKTVITKLTTKRDTQNISICLGDTVLINSIKVYRTGKYNDTLLSQESCDSIMVTVIKVNKPTYSYKKFTFCAGDHYLVDTTSYSGAGIYMDTLVNSNGCDSILETTIVVLSNSTVFQKIHLCPRNSYLIGSSSYSSNGMYSDTFTNTLGCDSIVITEIIIEDEYSFSDTIRFCEGEQTTGQKTIIDTAGDYTFFYESTWGCDSIHQLSALYFEDNRCVLGKVFLPNAFTPNQDGVNDDFGYTGENIIYAKLAVYDRWGEKVFDKIGTNPRWSGNHYMRQASCSEGVYFYKLEALSEEHLSKTYSGTITLVR